MLHAFIRCVVLGTLLCLLVSCSFVQAKPTEIKVDHIDKYTLHLDTHFTQKERDAIIDTFLEWERDTHGVVRFIVSPQNWNSATQDIDSLTDKTNECTMDVYVASLSSKHESVIEFEKEGKKGNTLGYTVHLCEIKYVAFVMDRIKIKEGKIPGLLQSVGVHEAGHLIGLAHIPVPKESIMFPSVDYAAKCPTELDMKQFCLLHGCNWHDMKSCDNKEK